MNALALHKSKHRALFGLPPVAPPVPVPDKPVFSSNWDANATPPGKGIVIQEMKDGKPVPPEPFGGRGLHPQLVVPPVVSAPVVSAPVVATATATATDTATIDDDDDELAAIDDETT